MQSSVDAESMCDVTARTEKRGRRGKARGIIAHLNRLNIYRECGLAGWRAVDRAQHATHFCSAS